MRPASSSENVPPVATFVCIPDFDEPAGFCDEDSPRAAEVEAAKAQQAAQAWKGIDDVFGVAGAIQKGMAQASAQVEAGQATCPTDGTRSPAGTKFCPNCGQQLQPVPVACPKCGTENVASAKFCTNCGTNLGSE